MNLTGATMDALQLAALLLVREHPIPGTDTEHMRTCPARHLDLSPIYSDFTKQWEIVDYIGSQVSSLTNGELTVRAAGMDLFWAPARTPDILYLAVCNGITPMGTLVCERTDETRLLTLRPSYGGLDPHAHAR